MALETDGLPLAERWRRAGAVAAELIESGARVGLGTGRTATAFIRALAARRLDVRCVATSRRTAALARRLGLRVLEPEELPRLDVAVDGADEVDPDLDLVKGRGGALLRERVVATAAARFVVVVDGQKQVPRLGRGPLPVEIAPFAWSWTLAELGKLAAAGRLRRDAVGQPVRTDNGNYLAEIDWHEGDKRALAAALDALPGVLDHGLFLGMAHLVLVGVADGSVERIERRG